MNLKQVKQTRKNKNNEMDISDHETQPNNENESDNNAMEVTETEPNKDRKARPSELKEKDPILEAFRNLQNQEELEILLADYNKKKLKSSKVSETEIETL